MESPIITSNLKSRVIDALQLEMTALSDQMLDEPGNRLIRNQYAELKAMHDFLDGTKCKTYKLIAQ